MNYYECSGRKFETFKDECDRGTTSCYDRTPGYVCSCYTGYVRATKYHCKPKTCPAGKEFIPLMGYGYCQDIDECSKGLHSKYIRII